MPMPEVITQLQKHMETGGELPINELRDATLQGNKRRLDELILKVSEIDEAGCAHALRELADKYEYDALTRLLAEACRR